MRPLIVELLLWDNCNNNCDFCHLKTVKEYSAFLTDEEKETALMTAVDFITGDDRDEKYDLLLCGGELFDTQFPESCKKAFQILTLITLNEMKNGKINDLFVNTNLIYDVETNLRPFLDSAKEMGVLNRIHFTTSFDLVGRYKTDEDKNLVKNNISLLREKYPDMPITANMILTKPVCNLFINGDISYAALQQELGVTINLIPYIILKEKLAPSRTTLFEALDAIEAENPGFTKALADRFDNEPDRRLLKFYQGELHDRTSASSPSVSPCSRLASKTCATSSCCVRRTPDWTTCTCTTSLRVCSIASAIADFSDLKALGRMAIKIVVFYLFTSMIAISIGYLTYQIFPIGNPSLAASVSDAAASTIATGQSVKISIKDTIVDIIPNNVITPFQKSNKQFHIIFINPV